MSYTVTDVDKFLKGKKYGFYQLITDPNKGGLGAKDPRVIKTKKLWQAAENAKGVNSKLDAFKELQDDLNETWFTDARKERLNKLNEHIAANNSTPDMLDPENKEEYDVLSKLFEYSDMPAVDELQNLQLGEAFSENYSPKQMAELAKQYGYDYKDKDERAEFLTRVGEYARQKDVEKIWNDDIYTSLITPVTKEYAKKNYQNINDLGDIAAPLAADIGVNTLMAGTPGSVFGSKATAQLVDNVVAPLAREAANMKLNDKSFGDAAKDAAAGIVTNFATPYAINRSVNTVGRLVTTEEKRAAQDMINKEANEVRSIYERMKNGATIGEIGPDGYVTFSKLDKRSWTTPSISSDEAARAGDYISPEEMDKFWKNLPLLRNNPMKRALDKRAKKDIKQMTADKQDRKEYWEIYKQEQADDIAARMAGGTDDYYLNSTNPASRRFEGMDAYKIADAAKIKPKESFWNWAPQTEAYKAGNAYVTNLQGQSRYAGPVYEALARQIPGLDKVDLTVKERPNVDDPEMKMLKRLYELHKKYPKLVDKPELPEKWKKDYKIEDIF